MALSKPKTKFSKKSKKAWRKTDIADVENYYEDKLLEERLGGSFSEKANEELFFIETKPPKKVKKNANYCSVSERKKRALIPPSIFKALENTSKVPPIVSPRKRAKPKEERKSDIRKETEKKLKEESIKKKRDITKRKLKRDIKRKQMCITLPFSTDIWSDKNEGDEKEWLEEDTVRHIDTNTGKIKVKAPKSVYVKPSALPTVEAPHPGLSYNPATEDHSALVEIVVNDKKKIKKEQDYYCRVGKFKTMTRKQMMNDWLVEMSQGLDKDGKVVGEEDEDNEENNEDYKVIHPPAVLKRKTSKQRKRAKALRNAELEKQKEVVEKKKISDMYRLKFMERNILQKQIESEIKQEKRKDAKAAQLYKTKKLGRNIFNEPLPSFQDLKKMKKNLRLMKPDGNILKDRFKSLQKRNFIEAIVKKKNIPKKKKVKSYVKKSHKVDKETGEMINPK